MIWINSAYYITRYDETDHFDRYFMFWYHSTQKSYNVKMKPKYSLGIAS